jgi:hypothetical protein
MPQLLELGRTFGILCLSRNWDNLLLWSHYGDGHKGLCLGFDMKESDAILDVRYQPNLLQADELRGVLGNPAEALPFVQRLLATKHEIWNYEQEVRAFTKLIDPPDECGRHFFSFGIDLQLKEVIIGVRCCAERAASIRSLTKDYGEGVECTSAYMKPDAFLLGRANAANDTLPRPKCPPVEKARDRGHPANDSRLPGRNFFAKTTSCCGVT